MPGALCAKLPAFGESEALGVGIREVREGFYSTLRFGVTTFRIQHYGILGLVYLRRVVWSSELSEDLSKVISVVT